MEIPLNGGFYVSDSLPVAHQQCVNWYPVVQQGPAMSQAQLFGTVGIEQVATTGSLSTDVNRGSHDLAGIPYFVNGNSLYRLNRGLVAGEETFSTTALGTIAGIGRVSMADNGTQLMILVPGIKGYIYTVAGGLVEITDPDLFASGDPQHVVFIDGYFAVTTDSKAWIVSALNDGTSWDALDFSSAEADPDPIVAPVVHNNTIYIIGSQTTEGFENIGGTGFPFQRNGIILDKGCAAPFSLVNSNQQFFMIGGGKDESPAVWSFSGGAYNKVSTIVIDSILAGYSVDELDLAFSLAWGFKGQYFVSFVFNDRALTYNQSTGIWHEQKSGIENSDGDYDQTRWRVNSIITAYNHVLVGDYTDGRIGMLTDQLYQEYGTNIIRVFSTPPIQNNGNPFRIPNVELFMETGVGNGVVDPQVSMSISEDAKIFDYERNRPVGPIGKYNQRIIWRKNGRVPNMCVLQFRLSDPIKPVIIKLVVDVI